jgi:hypothetical protein
MEIQGLKKYFVVLIKKDMGREKDQCKSVANYWLWDGILYSNSSPSGFFFINFSL